MNNILLVSDHPEGFTGNGHMLSAILDRIDYTKFKVTAFATTPSGLPFSSKDRPYQLIEGGLSNEDPFGAVSLLNMIQSEPPDVLMFVGLDIWKFYGVYDHLITLKEQKKFKWISLFPYDFTYFREDWKDWLAPIDVPLVYSKYGLDQLKDVDSRVQYFRPPLFDADKFTPYDPIKRKEKRNRIFQAVSDDTFLFGFFGVNQVRKDPLRLIKAFFNVKKIVPNISLYMHTEAQHGVYNIKDYLTQQGNEPGDVFVKKQGSACTTPALVDLYNSCDCLVNTSLQEGLSWTLLEAMLSGLPVIAADNTSQTELIYTPKGDLAAMPIKCTGIGYIPVQLPSGLANIEARTCDMDALEDRMVYLTQNKYACDNLKEQGLIQAKKWIEEVSDINEVLGEAVSQKNVITLKQKMKKILFVQHSSAGDVLMTTQCFKGIKEKHKGMPLVYMTQPIYQDIVQNNPYIDEIIDYNEKVIKDYLIVYNPHAEKILPGGWNNLDVTLYSMYPYFCKVNPSTMFIDLKRPDFALDIGFNDGYIVVHTTGGSAEYRSYAHMDKVISKLPYPTIQIGGKLDRRVEGALDLRGKLSFRETAYVMKNAKAAVVIDSFPSHLAGALGTPVVVLYGPAPARVTQPRGDKERIINLEPNMLDVCGILSHCWSTPPSGKKKCTSPCINTISPLKIINAVKKLLDK